MTGLKRDWVSTAGGGAAAALAVLLAACGIGGPDVATLEVSQPGWDSLAISVRFADRDLVGRSIRAEPSSVHLTVFNASYDTLYSGADTLMAVDDRRLGDGEPILVEACGRFDSRTVCEQQTVFASPKRVWSRLEVEYPSDDEYMRGTYRVTPFVERRVFGTEEWEELPGAAVPPLSAEVRIDGSEEHGIRLPLRSRRGPFDLRGGEGYRDFRFNLRSAFRDSGRAEVVFQVLAGEEGRESPAGSVRIALVDKSEEEQLEELERLVEGAGRRIIAQLRGFFGSGRTYVFVNSWSYDSSDRAYEAELEFHLGSFGRSSWFELTGRLVAAEDGSEAVFHLLEADRDTGERWRDRVGADSLRLGRIVESRTSDRTPVRAWG